jgi:hypothetical protein
VEYYFIIFLITAFRNFTFNSAENSTNFSFQLNSKNRKIIKLHSWVSSKNSYFPSSAMFQQTFTFGSFLKIFTMMLTQYISRNVFFHSRDVGLLGKMNLFVDRESSKSRGVESSSSMRNADRSGSPQLLGL